jgi:hypothetical protein
VLDVGELYNCPTGKYNQNTKRKNLIFCTKECFYRYKTRTVVTNCATCNKEITKRVSEIQKVLNNRVYCSKSCATIMNNTLFKSGENHPLFKTGEGSYRVRTLRTRDNICADCGNTDERVLEVHHIDKNRKNNKDENLVIVCANCHKIRHYKWGM